jgi:hypothetical protein
LPSSQPGLCNLETDLGHKYVTKQEIS